MGIGGQLQWKPLFAASDSDPVGMSNGMQVGIALATLF